MPGAEYANLVKITIAGIEPFLPVSNTSSYLQFDSLFCKGAEKVPDAGSCTSYWYVAYKKAAVGAFS